MPSATPAFRNCSSTAGAGCCPELEYYREFVILIPEGGEELRDTLAINIGDERCRWAYVPDEPANIPCVIAGAKRMWTDEVARLCDIPEARRAQGLRDRLC